MARVAYRVNPSVAQQPQFPELDRAYLLATYKASTAQCHPRLKSIRNGYAVFTNYLDVPYTPNCRINYRLICAVPLTDPLFNTDKNIEVLYYSQAEPYVQFVPQNYKGKNGYAISAPY